MIRHWLNQLKRRPADAPPAGADAPTQHPSRVRQFALGATCVVIIALAVWHLFDTFKPLPMPKAYAYYLDLDTQKIFVQDVMIIPPALTPTQTQPAAEGRAVRAVLFSCTTCENEKDRFIGYLEKYPPDIRAQLIARANDPHWTLEYTPNAIRDDISNSAVLLALPGSDRWYPVQSEEADVIKTAPEVRCGPGKPVLRCFPTPPQ